VLDEVRNALRGLVGGAGARAGEVSAVVEDGIGQLAQVLQSRTSSGLNDLRTLDAIANSVKMLGLHASIEARISSGAHPEFGRVAAEVRRLANSIIDTIRNVGTAMDDRLLQQAVHDFRATFDTVVSAIEHATGSAAAGADSGLARAGDRLRDLRENQR